MNGTAQESDERRSHCLRMAEIAPTDRIRQSLLRHAEHCEIEARLVERSRNCLSESRELLARVEALLSARLPPQQPARSSQGDTLRDAVERVFDNWTDRKASPLPRSIALH
jgi:hypothetical protein